MARPPTPLKDIGDHSSLWKIHVRVVDLWHVISKGGQQHIEMVLKDDKGDTIQAIIPSTDVDKFKLLLKEGNTYVMQSFKVQHNDLAAKVSAHPFRIILGTTALVREKELTNIPATNFQFQSFKNILNGKIKDDLLVDVIGAVKEIAFLQPGGDKRKAAFVLTDLCGDTLNCTLWDDYATKFITYYNTKIERNSNMVIILTHARVKEPQGRYLASVSNWWFGSKLLINDDIDEIQKFKKEIPKLTIIERPSLSLSQFTGGSQGTQGGTDEDRFMKGAQAMSLGQINSLQQDASVITVATIGRIEPLQTGWCYDGCTQCTKKTVKRDNNYYCLDGHMSLRPKKKYKIEVTVLDKKDRSRFLLWDTDVAKALEISADELMQKMFDEGEEDEKAYPLDIDSLCGKTAAFKIRAGPKNRTASVSWMWNTPDMVAKIQALIDPQEETSRLQITSGKQGLEVVEDCQVSKSDVPLTPTLQKTHTDTHDEVHFETQDLSATADFHPTANCKTPAKRNSPEVVNDTIIIEDFGSAQLSSTKKVEKNYYETKMKQIKKEKD